MPRDLSVWAEFWRRHVRLIVLPERLDLENGGYYIYRLARARAAPLPTPTLPGIEGAFSSVEGYVSRGQLQKVSRLVGTLEQIAGDYAEVKYFIGKVWYSKDAYRSYEYLKGADAGGLRELTLWEELAKRAEARWWLEEALVYYEKIARFEPRAVSDRHRRLLVQLAKRARKKLRPRQAERYLRRAITLDSTDAALWSELSEILVWLERRGEAVDAIEEAVRLDPDHRGYRGTLGHLRRAS